MEIKTIAKENKVNVFSDAQKARNDRNDQSINKKQFQNNQMNMFGLLLI